MNPTKKELMGFQLFAKQTARSAGRILSDGFNRTKSVKFKGRINPVTEYDLKSEKYITEQIRKRYPTHALLAEEGSEIRSDSGFCWVIDPLDGTVNYSHRLPVYCVSIGLLYNGTSVAGAVYDPESDEMYSATSGGGAFLNGKKIKVSSEQRLERALLATGFAYNIKSARRNNLGTFARMMKRAQAVRRFGSAALDLCWVAAGRLDGFWEYYLHPWDTAAAALVVQEAGGVVTRIGGKRYSIFANDILATNPHLYSPIKRALTSRSSKRA